MAKLKPIGSEKLEGVDKLRIHHQERYQRIFFGLHGAYEK